MIAEEPQRLGAAKPQPKFERNLNRRDAMSAEKTAGERILLEMRGSFLLHYEASVGSPAFVFSALFASLRFQSHTKTPCCCRQPLRCLLRIW